VMVLIAVGFWLLCRRKDLFFYFTVFFILMVPYLNLVYIGIWVAERYVYFSVFCLLALAVSLAMPVLESAKHRFRLGVLALGAVFILFNLPQTFLYQAAWRNAETLWQYNLAQPNPDPASYANLAVYYYNDALAKQGTPEMEMSMQKMSVVVDAGLGQFWPDHQKAPLAETYFLFFLQSIVQEVRGDLDGALASLLRADELHPGFDSTLLNLARLYHKLAEATTDKQQHRTYAAAAVERFNAYITVVSHGQPTPPELQKELSDLEADPALNQPAKSAP